MSDRVIVLVDGSNLVHALYHALAGATPVEILRTLRKRLESLGTLKPKPTALAVAFDAPGPNWRRELYPDYKGHRGEKDAALESLLEAAILDLQSDYDVLAVPGIEADDLIATRWQHAIDVGARVVIVSGDRDLWQLLRPASTSQLMAFRTSRGRVTATTWKTYDAFQASYGFCPMQWPMYKAIVGDKVDNLPGIHLLGEAAADVICRHYFTFAEALADRWSGKLTGRQIALLESAVRDGSAERFLKLCTVLRDVELAGEPV